MSDPDKRRVVQFAPLSSCVHPSFWSAFSKKKLEDIRLDESPLAIGGSYSVCDPPGLKIAACNVSWDALTANGGGELDLDDLSFPCYGRLVNTNTLEAFKLVVDNPSW